MADLLFIPISRHKVAYLREIASNFVGNITRTSSVHTAFLYLESLCDFQQIQCGSMKRNSYKLTSVDYKC